VTIERPPRRRTIKREGPATGGASSELANAQALLRSGRVRQARGVYAEVFAAGEHLDDGMAMGEAALGYCGFWINEHRSADEFTAAQLMLRKALLACEPASLLAARLNVRLVADTFYAGRADHDHVAAAVAVVRRHGQPSALAEALSLYIHTLLPPAHAEQRAHAVAEMLETAVACDDDVLVALALAWQTVDAFLRGDPEAVRQLRRMQSRCRDLDIAILTYLGRVIDLMLLTRDGQFDNVERALDTLFAEGVDAGEVDAETWYAGQLFTLRYCQGRMEELVGMAAELAESPQLTNSNRVFSAIAALLLAETGAGDRARIALARVAPFEPPPAGLTESSLWLVTLTAMAVAVHRLHDAELARQCYDALAPYPGLPAIGSLAVVCLGSVDLALALSASAFGDHALAASHFERAIAGNIRLGHLPMIAICRAEYASELALAGDNVRAREFYTEALVAAEALAMTGWLRRWTHAAAELDVADVPHGSCRRRGRVWEIDAPLGMAIVSDSVGMRALAALLANPSQDLPVAALTGAVSGSSRQALLDEPMRSALRRQIAELESAVAEASTNNDIERASQARKELDQLLEHIRRSVDGTGKSRVFADPVEYARTSTQKALRRTLSQIAEQAPALAAELGLALRTGATCRFDPRPAIPSCWTVTER
jgi:CheY-like chemotaxis protein